MKTFLYLFVICLIQFSCKAPRYVYSPSAQNVPVFTQKGDSKLSALYSTNWANRTVVLGEYPYSRGVDVQAAYAITNHWAVQANYFDRNEKNGQNYLVNSGNLIKYRRHLLEGGLGYYAYLKDKLILQCFAGFGSGKFKFTDYTLDSIGVSSINYHYASVNKFFIQPAIVFHPVKHTSFAFSSRFSFVDYYSIQTNYDNSQLSSHHLNLLPRQTYHFWELAIVITHGLGQFPYLRLEGQLGFSLLLNQQFVETRPFHFSIGMYADIPRLFKDNSR